MKTIPPKSLGKHIGHACEGHLRGLLSRIAAKRRMTLINALPFALHVKPDGVLADTSGKVHVLAIVAYWNQPDSSHKKYHRTRSEYVAAQMAQQDHSCAYTKSAKTITVIYGAPNGWKDQIISDLRSNCAPVLFLPDVLGASGSNRLVKSAFACYLKHWKAGKSSARDMLAKEVATKATTPDEDIVIAALQKAVFSRVGSIASRTRSSAVINVRVPTAAIRTRYRQALGILAVFPDGEISAWLHQKAPILTAHPCAKFAFRAHFLGVGDITVARRIGRIDPMLNLKQAKRKQGAGWVYAPDLIDFTMWESLAAAKVISILDEHRDLTRNPTPVFRGGAFDQCCGNWRGICGRYAAILPSVISALKCSNVAALSKILESEAALTAETWHPASGSAYCMPLWGLLVCTLAEINQDRAIRSEYDSRRQDAPDSKASTVLAKRLCASAAAGGLLADVEAFASVLLGGNLAAVAGAKRPALLSLEHPCSWVSDFYNTLTTNSSHNPLNGPVMKWIKAKYPGHTWHGWPAKRSIALKDILGTTSGRRQWQFVGVDAGKKRLVAAEVKSITANHWGDKSKEIYDRVAESRATAKAAGFSIHCVGVLDGDVGTAECAELKTGIGYDDVYSIEEVL